MITASEFAMKLSAAEAVVCASVEARNARISTAPTFPSDHSTRVKPKFSGPISSVGALEPLAFEVPYVDIGAPFGKYSMRSD
jgi:hypothetical protein